MTQSMKPAAYKRAASAVVPEADIYKQATTPVGSTFKPADVLAKAFGKQMNFQKSDDFWKDVTSNTVNVANKLTGMVKATENGFKFDVAELRKQVGDTIGNYSFINDLTDGQLDKLSQYMDVGSYQLMYKNIQDNVESVKDLAEFGDFKSASGIIDAAKSILGVGAVVDIISNSAIFGVTSLVLDFVEQTGITKLFDDILDKVKDEKTLAILLEQRALSAAGEGDISLCRHYVDKMGSSRAYAIKNDLIPMIVSSYAIQADDSRPYRERANEIVSLLGAIDSTWYIENGRPSTRWFHPMSEDCVLVFSQLDNGYAGLAIGCKLISADMNATDIASSTLGVVFTE